MCCAHNHRRPAVSFDYTLYVLCFFLFFFFAATVRAKSQKRSVMKTKKCLCAALQKATCFVCADSAAREYNLIIIRMRTRDRNKMFDGKIKKISTVVTIGVILLLLLYYRGFRRRNARTSETHKARQLAPSVLYRELDTSTATYYRIFKNKNHTRTIIVLKRLPTANSTKTEKNNNKSTSDSRTRALRPRNITCI